MAMSAGAGGFSQGNHNVFVYGSLLSDEVVHVLLNRVPVSSPAILPHFQRFSIKGRVYPAILPFENSKVLGRVLTGVTNLELDILDDFEDDEYVRDSVDVTLVDDSEKLQAYTYVWDKKDDPCLCGDWDFEKWRAAHMNDFIEMTKEFVEELEQPESKSRVETYNSFYRSSDDKSTSA